MPGRRDQAACGLIEAQDEWQDSDHRFFRDESMALPNPPEPTAIEPPAETGPALALPYCEAVDAGSVRVVARHGLGR